MNQDFSWHSSAENYLQIYARAMHNPAQNPLTLIPGQPAPVK